MITVVAIRRQATPGAAIASMKVVGSVARRLIQISRFDRGFTMKLHGPDRRITATPLTHRLRPEFVILLLLILTTAWQGARAWQPADVPAVNRTPLTAEQVVSNLVAMNRHRFEALGSYQAKRIYRVDYKGFPGARSAEMVVSVKYVSPAEKEFVIESTSGSGVIIEKVFHKLLEAEKEALGAESQRNSALTQDNYTFKLVGYESGPSGAMYVLNVEPRKNEKYLYRGRIWVDADDFAVVRLEAEPARNPSFWTKKAEIVQEYTKVSDFWLPAKNHSMTAVRLGGHAELTIEYKDYEITGARRVSSLAPSRTTPPDETARVQR